MRRARGLFRLRCRLSAEIKKMMRTGNRLLGAGYVLYDELGDSW